ncbi:MAG TPA: DinB family protein [Dehalococcoidia bacterium]|nr:DinB family protein [Dehalococcoidia bacterium]
MTTQADEAQRVRGYLLAQANKLSIPELVEKVRRDTMPLREAGAAVPAARFAERPGPDAWSAAEVYTHILQMNETGARAIEGILDGGALPPPVRDTISGETSAGLTTAEAYWQAHTRRREQLLARVLHARGDEHLEIAITHQTFGAFNWREWLLFMRVHDLDHLRQLQAIAQQFAA